MARISLQGVSLTFRLRRQQRLTFKEYLLKRMFRRSANPFVHVNALQDITLDIPSGERLGIIGHNGAGKSTLLKVLAGIYPPTSGAMDVQGRVSSLFDIALGFEPDSTGWENICFRGYLQGETPRTIKEKMQPIADFSELGDFLNMQVRYYSAGMRLRLAFSIATAIDPQVLLVDEVLSVGDMAFTEKASQRMRDMMDRAQLIVMVSHDLESIKRLCQRVIWLDHGRIRQVGAPAEVVSAYTNWSNGAGRAPSRVTVLALKLTKTAGKLRVASSLPVTGFGIVLNPPTVARMGPLSFVPFLRSMVWGGRRLGERLGKNLPGTGPFGESWEISDHASHSSIVAGGPLEGRTLRDLMTHHADEMLGRGAARHSVFPWLVKHLDVNDRFSVQVHPTDAQAKARLPGELGKTEVWFIIEALPGSRVFAGLLPGVQEMDMRAALAAGTVEKCLHSFEPRPGDCVFLPAGTVHAAGGGVLMIEVQQTSDATFRLFDWNRVDKNGKARQLHVEEAMACINWRSGPVSPVRVAEATADAGRQTRLVSCEYFHLDGCHMAQSFGLDTRGRLQVLIPFQGRGEVVGGGTSFSIAAGQAWALPAAMPAHRCVLENPLAYLLCTLPD